MSAWREQLERWAAAIAPHAIEPPDLDIKPPATPQQVEAIEQTLGRPIPAPLRRFILEDSAGIFFFWLLPEDAEVIHLDEGEQPIMGSIESSIDMPAPRSERDTMVGFLGDDAPEATRERWRKAFKFLPVANGDAVALDLMTDPDNPPVVYLDHETAETYRLADSFDEFIKNWFAIGCVGPEGWILRHFMADNGKPLPPGIDGTPTSKIDPDCPNAKAFRAFFGM